MELADVSLVTMGTIYPLRSVVLRLALRIVDATSLTAKFGLRADLDTLYLVSNLTKSRVRAISRISAEVSK